MVNIGLTQIVTPEKIEYSGRIQVLVLTAGKTFKIEDSPDGTEHIVGVVPAGKKWRIDATVHIHETSV